MATSIEVDAFVEMGVACSRQGRLAEGLELLAARLDYAGAGALVAALLDIDWSPRASKQAPNPTPKTPPPPPASPPPKRR